MHTAIFMTVKASGADLNAINARIAEVLNPYSPVSPFPNCYIVKVAGENDRMSISKALVDISKSFHDAILFVMTPLMANGKYQGFLPSNYWELLNKQTD